MLELEVVPEHGLQGDAIEFLLGETIATTTLIITMVDLVLGPVRDPLSHEHLCSLGSCPE